MRPKVLAVVFALCLGPADALRADTFAIDKGHTVVAFSWHHLGMTRQEGRFPEVEGTLAFDPAKPEESRLEVAITTGSITTGYPERDRHLRTSDFFDAANHRTMTFKATDVKVSGEKTGEVTGELTIRGVTKPVTLAVVWHFTGDHPLAQFNTAFAGKTMAAFSARATIKRSEWGLSRVIPLISDAIEIRIESELIRKE